MRLLAAALATLTYAMAAVAVAATGRPSAPLPFASNSSSPAVCPNWMYSTLFWYFPWGAAPLASSGLAPT